MPTYAFVNLSNEEITPSFDMNLWECINSVRYFEFTDVESLFSSIQKVTGKNKFYVDNIYYDTRVLIQVFYFDTSDNPFVITKRLIREDDNYVFEKHISYEFLDIEPFDIITILRHKHLPQAVFINSDGSLEDVTYYHKNVDTENLTGCLCIKYGDTEEDLVYANLLQALINRVKKDQVSTDENNNPKIEKVENQTKEAVNEIMKILENPDVKYIYTTSQVSWGIVHIYCQKEGHERNEQLSTLLNKPIYGKALVYFENNQNNNNRILSVDSSLVRNILERNQTYQPKNTKYFNIYYEFS